MSDTSDERLEDTPEVPETPEPLEAVEVDQTLHPVDPNVVLPDPDAPADETPDEAEARRRERGE